MANPKKKKYNDFNEYYDAFLQGKENNNAKQFNEFYNAFLQGNTKTNTQAKKKKNSLFDSDALDDGYQFGDVTKTALGTGANIANTTRYILEKGVGGAVKGVTNIPYALGTEAQANIEESKKKSKTQIFLDALTEINPVAKAVKSVKNDIKYAKEEFSSDKSLPKKLFGTVYKAATQDNGIDYAIQGVGSLLSDKGKENVINALESSNNKIMEFNQAIDENLNEQKKNVGKVGRVVGDVSEVVGNMSPSIAATLITKDPNVGLATMGMSAKGAATQEALQGGATLQEATKYGDAIGATEVATELLSGGLKIFGGGALDDVAEKYIGKIENKVFKGAAKIAYTYGGETAEELISDLVSVASQQATWNPDAKYTLADMGETTGLTILSTLALNILTGGYVNGSHIGSGVQIDKESLIQDTIDNYEKETGNKITDEQRQFIIDQVNNIDILTNASVGLENQNGQNQVGNSNLRATAYTNDLSQYSETQQSVIQNAIDSGILNNTEDTHKFVDFLAKIAEDKGLTFRFVNNEILSQERNIDPNIQVNGFIEGNNVTVNIDSQKALNQVVGHEITHVLENTPLYDQLAKAVKEYAESKGEYETKLNKMQELYDGFENVSVEYETISDLVGEYLFTDENFVNNLAVKNRNLFQRIFDEIKHLYKIVTSGSKQARQLEKVKYIFEKAYSSPTINVADNARYSIDNNSAVEYNKDIEKKHNSIQEAIDEDPRKAPYAKYNTSLDLFNLDYEQMKSVIAQLSDDAQQAKLAGLNNDVGVVSINNKLYDAFFDLVNQENENNEYAVTKLKPIDEGVENDYDNTKETNSYIEEYIRRQEKTNSSNSELARNRETAGTNDDIFSKQSSEQGINENGQLTKEKSTNNRELDSSFSNTKYSLSVKESNTGIDNDGRKLSKDQQEYFKDSKATDENGNLITVYHTMTDKGVQFNEFNPVGTEGYKFGNNVVNFYTNSKTMSSSYADYKQTQADTSKLNNIQEARNWIKNQNSILSEYDIKDLGKDGYSITENGQSKRYFKNKTDLLKNLKQTFYEYNKQFGSHKGQAKYQYEGYVNITNPYIIDAEESNWDEITDSYDEMSVRYANEIKSEDKQALIDLAEESEQKYKDYLKELDNIEEEINDGRNEKYYTIRGVSDTQRFREDVLKQLKGKYKEKISNLLDKYESLRKEQHFEDDYFRQNVSDIQDKINNEYNMNFSDFDLYKMAVSNFDKSAIKSIFGNKSTTNDVIKNVLRMNENGSNYDGVIIKNVLDYGSTTEFDDTGAAQDVYVTFNSNQFKATDNKAPTTDADIRYSLSNQNEDIAPVGDYNVYGEQIKKQVDESIAPIKQAVEEIKTSLKDIAPVVKSLDEVKKTVDNVKDTFDSIKESDVLKVENSTEDSKEVVKNNKKTKLSRKEVRNFYKEQMGITTDDLLSGKDIATLNYQRTTPIRVVEKVFSPEVAQKINDALFIKERHNEAERVRFINEMKDQVKELGFKDHSKESAAVQKYAEKQYVNDAGELVEYGDKELENEFRDVNTQDRIKEGAKLFRQLYDQTLEQVNGVLERNGYDKIEQRKDYMPHFQEMTDFMSRWGLPFNRESMNSELLPTDINGLTEMFSPGKSWFANAQRRKGIKTVYDAVTGFDKYIDGISNLIYHTDDIQRYRALEEQVRTTFGQSEGYDNILSDPNATDDQIEAALEGIKTNQLSGFARWLHEQGNALANKKSAIDRAPENLVGRKIYQGLSTLKKQVGSNMTGLNVRSAMTNFISSTIASAKTNKIAMAKGTYDTIKNIFHDDGFVDKSDFLTSRLKSDNQLSKKLWQKASNAGQIFMNGSDWFTANMITRSKYYEGLSHGLTENQAIQYADDFAARVLGDRSKGQTAELFNSKTLGFLTQFQLETTNQWDYMIHDTKQEIKDKSALKAGATVVFEMGQLAAYSYLFNEMFEKLTGGRAAFDPIEIFKKLFGKDDDDDEGNNIEEAANLLLDALPFGNLISGGGRLPVTEALPIKELIGGKDKYGNDKSRLKTLKETLPYYLLPTGYSQAKKTTQGLSMYDKNLPVKGSYTDSGNLRYTVEDTPESMLKSALFGRWSSEEAQDYIDSGFKTISASNIEEMKNLGMNSTEYRKYRKELNESGKKVEDKLNYIKDLDIPYSDKNIMAKGVANRDIDMDEYDNYDSYHEFNYAKKYPGKYAVSKALGDNFNNYLEYTDNIYDIKADKDKNGKSITGSRKKKVYDYINSLDGLNFEQKCILAKLEYNSDNRYNNQIIQYLNNSNLDYDTEASILKELGFKVSDDGRITW